MATEADKQQKLLKSLLDSSVQQQMIGYKENQLSKDQKVLLKDANKKLENLAKVIKGNSSLNPAASLKKVGGSSVGGEKGDGKNNDTVKYLSVISLHTSGMMSILKDILDVLASGGAFAGVNQKGPDASVKKEKTEESGLKKMAKSAKGLVNKIASPAMGVLMALLSGLAILASVKLIKLVAGFDAVAYWFESLAELFNDIEDTIEHFKNGDYGAGFKSLLESLGNLFIVVLPLFLWAGIKKLFMKWIPALFMKMWPVLWKGIAAFVSGSAAAIAGLIIAAIYAGYKAITKAIDRFKSSGSWTEAILVGLMTIPTAIMDLIINGIGWLLEQFDFTKDIGTALKNWDTANFFMDMIIGIQVAFTDWWRNTKKVMKQKWKEMLAWSAASWASVKAYFIESWDSVVDWFSGIFDGVSNWFSSFSWDSMSNTVGDWSITKYINDFIAWWDENMSWENIKGMVSGFAASDFFVGIKNWFNDNMKKLKEYSIVKTIAQKVVDFFTWAMKGIKEKVLNFFRSDAEKNAMAAIKVSLATLEKAAMKPGLDEATKGQILAQAAQIRKSLSHFQDGGLVQGTGVAMLHGTPQQPELVLDAKKTKDYLDLAKTVAQGNVLPMSKESGVGGSGQQIVVQNNTSNSMNNSSNFSENQILSPGNPAYSSFVR